MRLYEAWVEPGASRGPRFICNGRFQCPSRRDSTPPFLTTLLLLLGSILFGVTAALSPGIALGFTGAGIALLALMWITLIRILISDPGLLPKHVTAIPGLSPISLRTPVDAHLVGWVGGGGTSGSTTTLSSSSMFPFATVEITTASSLNHRKPPLVEVIESKFCVTCRIWRPTGAHHCSSCGGCVDGFDHHCGVLGKCVGKGNARDFLLFLWCAAASTAYAIAYCLVVIISDILSRRDTDGVGGPSWVGDDQTQVVLWAVGGTLFGLMLCCSTVCKGTRVCTKTACGMLLLFIFVGGGMTCLAVAYARGRGIGNTSESSSKGGAIIAMFAAPLFLYFCMFVSGMAVATTCLWASRHTTKEMLRGSGSSKAATPNSTASISTDGISISEASASSSGTGNSGDNSNNSSNGGNSTTTTGDGASARGGGDSVSLADGLEAASKTPLGTRLHNLAMFICAPPQTPNVDFRSDVSQFRELYKQAEKAIFDRAEVRAAIAAEEWRIKQTRNSDVVNSNSNSNNNQFNPLTVTVDMNASSLVVPTTTTTTSSSSSSSSYSSSSILAAPVAPVLPECPAVCKAALIHSLAPGMLEDALELAAVMEGTITYRSSVSFPSPLSSGEVSATATTLPPPPPPPPPPGILVGVNFMPLRWMKILDTS